MVCVLNDLAKEADRATIEDTLRERAQALNATTEKHARIGALILTTDPWTIENEVLTPTWTRHTPLVRPNTRSWWWWMRLWDFAAGWISAYGAGIPASMLSGTSAGSTPMANPTHHSTTCKWRSTVPPPLPWRSWHASAGGAQPARS
jgi:hypothetical protein